MNKKKLGYCLNYKFNILKFMEYLYTCLSFSKKVNIISDICAIICLAKYIKLL